MCVLPSLIPVSCTRWANTESLFFGGFRPWPVAGWVEDMSKLCLADVLVAIYGHTPSSLFREAETMALVSTCGSSKAKSPSLRSDICRHCFISRDEAEVRIRESTLSRTEEERAPTVRYLCAGESVCEPQKTVGRSVDSSLALYGRSEHQC